MIKLTFLIRSLDIGGAQRQLIVLVKALSKKDFDITVLTFYDGGELEKELKDTNVKLISLEKGGRWDLWLFFWRLIDQINKNQPDILHGYLGIANIFTMFLKPLFPKTKIVLGLRSSNMDLSYYNWLSGVRFKLECWLSPWADLVIVNSHKGKNYYIDYGFPIEKMVVIPNGIDTEWFKPNPEIRRKIRQEWEISENTILIGLVGRLDPMKDHSTFLKAAALFSKDNKNVSFVCVGTGPEKYAQQLYELAEKLKISDKVIWTGTRTDMPAVYNALDIASSSSSYGEGFPNVVGEAMACGLPCVVTDVGDSAWIVGDVGIVIPPKNHQALARGWKALLTTNKKTIGIESRSRILQQFSIKHLADTTQNVLLGL